jgi:hypothetical protein
MPARMVLSLAAFTMRDSPYSRIKAYPSTTIPDSHMQAGLLGSTWRTAGRTSQHVNDAVLSTAHDTITRGEPAWTGKGRHRQHKIITYASILTVFVQARGAYEVARTRST